MSSTTFDRNIFFKALLPILTCIVIWLIPIPEGLEPKAWHMFAIFAATDRIWCHYADCVVRSNFYKYLDYQQSIGRIFQRYGLADFLCLYSIIGFCQVGFGQAHCL